MTHARGSAEPPMVANLTLAAASAVVARHALSLVEGTATSNVIILR